MAAVVTAVLLLMFMEAFLVPGGVPISKMKLGFCGPVEYNESKEIEYTFNTVC